MDDLKRLAGLLLAMALVGAGFVIVLGIGIELHGPASDGLERAIVVAAFVAIVATIGLVRLIRSYGGRKVPLIAERRREFRPQPPNEAQAAYARDPVQLATCPHLQPIERGMRAAGIRVALRYGNVVVATCVIDEPALRAGFDLSRPAYFTDSFPGDRPGDPPHAVFGCAEHGSSIGVTHPDDAPPGTPRFPAS